MSESSYTAGAARDWETRRAGLERFLRRWVWLLVVGLVVGVAGAAVGLLAAGTQYRAEAIVLFDQPLGTASPANGNETVQKLAALMNTYAVLATSDPVLDSVRTSTGMHTSLSHLRHKITATQVPATLAVSVVAKDAKAARARTLAQADATTLRSQVLSIQQRGGVPAAYRFTIDEIQQPTATKESNHEGRTLIAAGVFGLLAALVIAYLIERSRLPD